MKGGNIYFEWPIYNFTLLYNSLNSTILIFNQLVLFSGNIFLNK